MLRAIQKKIKNKKGFTLIELIVVLAILGIIAAIGVPKFTQIQQNSRIKADHATASQITKAARLQETETGKKVPNYAGLNSDYFDNNTKPQSGGTFEITGGETNPYVVKWTAKYGSGTDSAQTYTESGVTNSSDDSDDSDDD